MLAELPRTAWMMALWNVSTEDVDLLRATTPSAVDACIARASASSCAARAPDVMNASRVARKLYWSGNGAESP